MRPLQLTKCLACYVCGSVLSLHLSFAVNKWIVSCTQIGHFGMFMILIIQTMRAIKVERQKLRFCLNTVCKLSVSPKYDNM